MEALPTVRLKRRRNSKHPWIYRKMCEPAEHAPGTLVEVFDRDGAFVGRGIYNRNSQIAIRLLTEDPAQPLDDAFLGELLDRAIRFRREDLVLDRVTDAYRVVHAESDGLPGLVVDRYGSFVVAQLYSAGWFRKLRWLMPALSARFGGARVLVRGEARAERHEGFKVRDFEAEKGGPLRTIITEHGIRYHVDLRAGHKTGFFCDQRDHRLRVQRLAAGKRVLDVCSYTGGFALNAARGGAASVAAVDLDEKAVSLARENAVLNAASIDFRHADGFDFLRAAPSASFDLVVLDPPKFAAGRAEIAGALERYRDLNALASKVVAPGGTLITCSCSGPVSEMRFQEAVLQGAKRAGVELTLVEAGGASPDHPVRPEFPEGRYLKVLTFRRG